MFVHLCCGSTVEPKTNQYLILLIMENKIFTLSDLQKEGNHIAKLAANRNIRTKVVAKKKEKPPCERTGNSRSHREGHKRNRTGICGSGFRNECLGHARTSRRIRGHR